MRPVCSWQEVLARGTDPATISLLRGQYSLSVEGRGGAVGGT